MQLHALSQVTDLASRRLTTPTVSTQIRYWPTPVSIQFKLYQLQKWHPGCTKTRLLELKNRKKNSGERAVLHQPNPRRRLHPRAYIAQLDSHLQRSTPDLNFLELRHLVHPTFTTEYVSIHGHVRDTKSRQWPKITVGPTWCDRWEQGCRSAQGPGIIPLE